MKQKLLSFILLSGLLCPAFFVQSQNFPPLTCERLIESKDDLQDKKGEKFKTLLRSFKRNPVWTPIPGDRKADGAINFKNSTQALVLAAELNFFLDQTLTPALQDNTHNINNLVDEVIYRSRETHLCMREICDGFFLRCKIRSDKSSNACLKIKVKCESDVNRFFVPEKGNQFPLLMTLNKITLLENQERKDRTTLYEKFQGFFVRMGQYTIPLFIESNTIFSRIVNKVTKTITKPN